MHPRNTDKYCFGHLPPPCTASPAPQLRAHLRLLVVMIFAKGERNCTGRTVSEHLANRKAGKAHNKHAQMLTFSVARSLLVAIPRQDPLHLLTHFGALLPNHFCSNTISNRTASTVSCDNRFLLQKKKARLHLVKGRSYLAVPPFFVSFLTLFVA